MPRAGGPEAGGGCEMAGLSCRRRCLVGRREPRGLLRYSDEEWARIVQVAASVEMRPGAWVQLAAHDAAVRELAGERTGPESEADLGREPAGLGLGRLLPPVGVAAMAGAVTISLARAKRRVGRWKRDESTSPRP